MTGSAEIYLKLICSGFYLQVSLFFSSNNSVTILDRDLSQDFHKYWVFLLVICRFCLLRMVHAFLSPCFLSDEKYQYSKATLLGDFRPTKGSINKGLLAQWGLLAQIVSMHSVHEGPKSSSVTDLLKVILSFHVFILPRVVEGRDSILYNRALCGSRGCGYMCMKLAMENAKEQILYNF